MEECLSQEDVIQQLRSLSQLGEEGEKRFQFEDLRNLATSGMAPTVGEQRPVTSAEEGLAIGENDGKHVGSLPCLAPTFEEGNPLVEESMLGKETHAPKSSWNSLMMRRYNLQQQTRHTRSPSTSVVQRCVLLSNKIIQHSGPMLSTHPFDQKSLRFSFQETKCSFIDNKGRVTKDDDRYQQPSAGKDQLLV